MSEIDINIRLRNGDMEAFELLYKNYYSRLFAFVQRFVNDDIFAEDLVQGVFTSLWTKRGEIDTEKSISSYLMKSAKNACLDHLRHLIVKEKYIKNAILFETQQLYYIDFLENKFEPNIEEELKKSIDMVVQAMPDKCQTVFRMRWFDGLKNREIAEKLNISSTMVEKHLAKGISIMKAKFRKEYLMVLILLLEQID